jgi:broad specificity phosphatase PhoE
MRYLVLVKHSLPHIILTLPAHRWHLSGEGRLRCQALAEKLAIYSPGCILSSKEPKAVETAQLVADHLGQTFQIFEGLHEHDRSNVRWMGEERFEAQIDEFFRHPDRLVVGRETTSQAQLRFSHAVTSTLKQHADENVAIIAHGTVITLFVTQAVELDTFGFWKRLGLPSFVVMSLPEMELVNVREGFEEN